MFPTIASLIKFSFVSIVITSAYFELAALLTSFITLLSNNLRHVLQCEFKALVGKNTSDICT